ncbi:pyridoxal phosphate-dependent decarboxylase family protein [Nocardioides gilvus]|uniref:pyridoxal phosphate-dependent decarboxylase family protein n=1 Tax=Nocardioides gilvus TaxID=1735589 RepID=UPI000D74CA72|nr:aminotransferase class V-fold PLP-dependent enzyme [Nocardioides gilvus]
MTPHVDPTPALERLLELQRSDMPAQGGRSLAHIYDSGMPEVTRVGSEAMAAYANSNGLDPAAFPSVVRMENEVVGFAADLLHAPASAVGTVTSSGNESLLLAVQGARDSRPEVVSPSMVVPETAHSAFHRAAHYFGVRAVVVPVGADYRPDPVDVAAAIDATTVLVVVSAPSHAHGVIDPITEIAAVAHSRRVACHVDAGLGGWVLPYAEAAGRDVRPWDFRVKGVTSMSVDTHKYAYAPKGTSVLLHRSSRLRHPQYFAAARWPGTSMLNSTTQSTRSGGPVAGAWAIIRMLGHDGYRRLAGEVFEAVDRIVEGIAKIDGLSVVAEPESTLVAVETDQSCDPFTVIDGLAARGWSVQPQMSYGNHPATIHLTVSAATLTKADDFLEALAEAAAEAVETGPIVADPDILEILDALDPNELFDVDFGSLLDAAGMAQSPGSSQLLPQRMAPVNALLDASSPEMREALWVAFLDRLAKPVRATVPPLPEG